MWRNGLRTRVFKIAVLIATLFIVVSLFYTSSRLYMKVTYALFQRLKPGVQILFVGDPDQLPSVGAGNVLRELLRCGVIPTAVLDTVFRQALYNPYS